MEVQQEVQVRAVQEAMKLVLTEQPVQQVQQEVLEPVLEPVLVDQQQGPGDLEELVKHKVEVEVQAWAGQGEEEAMVVQEQAIMVHPQTVEPVDAILHLRQDPQAPAVRLDPHMELLP